MTAGLPPRVSRWPRRLLVPVVWMALGGLAVHYWHLQEPARRAAARVSSSAVTLVERAEGLFCAAPERLPTAAILHVVDGDTAEILWEGAPTFLRYYGVNTPEKGHPCYDSATARNRALSGAAVRLAFEERERDRYGRLLAYVFTADGRSVDAQLVGEGFGKAWRRDGRFRDRLAAAEDRARENKTGCLWSDEKPPKKPSRRKTKAKP